MKEQKFDLVDNAKLQDLNKHGWFVKQVVERCPGAFAKPSSYWVLLEKETVSGEESEANRAESALRDLAANHLDLVVCPQGCYFRIKGSVGREKSWTSHSLLPSWQEWFAPEEAPK